MPPKKGKKKDLLADREAEESRRLAEQERLKEEERARKERDAFEIKYKEQVAAFFSQEAPRIANQKTDFINLINQRQILLAQKLQEKVQQAEWTRYLECSILPSPKIERDLNTYLMLWDEEQLHFNEIPSLTTMYNQLPTALKLLKQMETEKGDLNDKEEVEKAKTMHTYIFKLVDILIKKWDLTTQQILQHVDLYPRESTENFQIEGEQDGFKFCLWANMTKNPRHKSVEFNDCGMIFTVPKPLALTNVGMRMIYSSDQSFCAVFEVQGAGARLSPLGGITYFDLMELPETPKKVDKWIICPILSKDGLIKRIGEYPFKNETEVVEENQDSIVDNSLWYIQLSFSIIPHCVIDSSAQVMAWDYQAQEWSRESIKEEEFEPETGRLRFKTMKFAPFALCQSTYLELPFKDWQMEPTGPEECSIRISGQKNEIKILIRENGCLLDGPLRDLHPGLKNWLSPSIFFKRLSQIGLNFVGPTSMNGVDIGDWVVKHSKAERGCIEGIGFFATNFKMKRSASNGAVSFAKCVFQFNEIGGAGDWKTTIYNIDHKQGDEKMNIAYVTNLVQVDDETRFAMDKTESKSIHSTIYHALESRLVDPENTPRSSAFLQRTVSEVLQITRVLAFS